MMAGLVAQVNDGACKLAFPRTLPWIYKVFAEMTQRTITF